MTLDETTELLGCSDEHAKNLVRDGILAGHFTETTVVERRRIRTGPDKGRMRNVPIRRTTWWFSGSSVRMYRKLRQGVR